ncbi:MAG: metallophosphoesterase [Arenimonas sp.]|nr:metallophosphoesterase [Rhizobium sp.]MBW8445483.1 metallophosphoesterase [Arenimonas sp.]
MSSQHTAPLLRFGLIADPQYAPIAPNDRLNRHYGQSLAKLEAAITRFNGEDLDFVVTLGDVIDRDWENFDRVLPLYDRLKHPHHFLPGNHDFAVAADRLAEVHAKLGMPAPWHDFVVNGVRLIVTDGNEVSLFAPPLDDPRRKEAAERLEDLTAAGAANAQMWNAGMSAAQVDWLANRLRQAEDAGERAIVFGHYPLYPESDHNLWGAEDVSALIAASPAAIGYFCGHNHAGNYGVLNGTHFVNIKGMVDTFDENAFCIVAVHADRIEIAGFGREESRVLAL